MTSRVATWSSAWSSQPPPTPPIYGNLKPSTIFGFRVLISPDLCMWIMPTSITAILFIGTWTTCSHVASLPEKGLLLAMVLTALGCSAACGLTDPGLIPVPNRALGRPDPYERDENCGWWSECRYCRLRRPPRASHCWTCGVCVLEHDHHCGVIGGCVGLRSLRWFVGYLVIISSSCMVGLTWLARSFYSGKYDMAAGSHWVAIHLVLGIFVGNVALMVGGLGMYYVYLACTNTTRREAQGKKAKPVNMAAVPAAVAGAAATGVESEKSALRAEAEEDSADEVYGTAYHERRRLSKWALRCRFGNFGRLLFPPPSLLDDYQQEVWGGGTARLDASQPV